MWFSITLSKAQPSNEEILAILEEVLVSQHQFRGDFEQWKDQFRNEIRDEILRDLGSDVNVNTCKLNKIIPLIDGGTSETQTCKFCHFH